MGRRCTGLPSTCSSSSSTPPRRTASRSARGSRSCSAAESRGVTAEVPSIIIGAPRCDVRFVFDVRPIIVRTVDYACNRPDRGRVVTSWRCAMRVASLALGIGMVLVERGVAQSVDSLTDLEAADVAYDWGRIPYYEGRFDEAAKA